MNSLVISLVPKFVQLQALILCQDGPPLEDVVVGTTANFCHNLQVLGLNKIFKLIDVSLYAIVHGCRYLTKLNIG